MEAILGFFAALFVTVSSIFSPTPTPTPTPIPTIIEMYQAKGETELYPFRVRYVLWFPKAGGEARGDIRGYLITSDNETCSASFRGLYGGNRLTGDIDGVCNILFLNQKITGTFTGDVDIQQRSVSGWVNGSVGSVKFSEYAYMGLQ